MAKRVVEWTSAEVSQLLRTTAIYEQLLRDALISLKHPLRQYGVDSKYQRQPEQRLRTLRTVRDWFLSDRDPSPFSFHRCCAMLSLDPMAVRDRLRRDGYLPEPPTLIAQHAKPNPRLQRAA